MFYVKATMEPDAYYAGGVRWVSKQTRSYMWDNMTPLKSMRLGFENRHHALWFAMRFAEKYPGAKVVVVHKKHCPTCKRSCSCTSS